MKTIRKALIILAAIAGLWAFTYVLDGISRNEDEWAAVTSASMEQRI